MIRPCFLVVDKEHPASISTRKLVIETAKMNVITAYSSWEAIETLKAFPSVNGIVLDGLMKDMPCGELIRQLHALNSELPIVVVGGSHCGDAVQHVDHYDPQTLLGVLRQILPQETKLIEEREAELVEQS